jgi:transglutaminase-like putative cysteine protease
MKSGLVDPSPSVQAPQRAPLNEGPLSSVETTLLRDRRAQEFAQGLRQEPQLHQSRKTDPVEGWLALGLLAIAVYAVVFAIIYANWVSHTGVLLWSTPAGLIAGFLVARTQRIPQLLLHLLACTGGFWLALWLTADVALHVPWLSLLENLRSLFNGDVDTLSGVVDEHIFLFYLTFLCFFLGYLGSWLTYRAHLPWLVALAYCSIMLVNLNYARNDLLLLLVILLGALTLLIARIHLAVRLEQWYYQGLYADRPWLRAMTGRFVAMTSLLMLATLLASWLLPTVSEPGWGNTFWNSLDNLASNIAHRHISWQDPSRLLQPYQEPTNFFADRLLVSSNVSLPSGAVLEYSGSGAPHYLEGVTYNQFDGHSWLSTTEDLAHNFPPGASLPVDAPSEHSHQVVTTVHILQNLQGTRNYIFGPPQPVSFSVPTTIYGRQLTSAWTQQTPLNQDEHYTVVSTVPDLTAKDLGRVPLIPHDPGFWQHDPALPVLETDYMQLPENLPPTILRTAQNWTLGAQNAYEAMLLLQSHLSNPRQFAYSLNNPPIPENVDVVSWLLQTQRGYCTYYATAMVVMARLLGMPARMVTGFSTGHFDSGRQTWVVNGSDAHSWVQVYFEGYGWIDFDPTPGFTLGPQINPGSTVQPGSGTPTTRSTPAPPTRQPTTTPQATARLGHPTLPGDNGQGDLLQAITLTLLLLLLAGSLLFLAYAVMTYRQRSQQRHISSIAALYWRLCRLASRAGLSPHPWQTPYEYSQQLSRALPQATLSLWYLTDLFVRDRWGSPSIAPQRVEKDEMEQLWPPLRRRLLLLCLQRLLHRYE